MTHRKKSPRKAASSVFNFNPAGQSINQLIVLCKAAMEYRLRILLMDSATHAELSMMYDPRAMPIMT
jgi:hypothetical protein